MCILTQLLLENDGTTKQNGVLEYNYYSKRLNNMETRYTDTGKKMNTEKKTTDDHQLQVVLLISLFTCLLSILRMRKKPAINSRDRVELTTRKFQQQLDQQTRTSHPHLTLGSHFNLFSSFFLFVYRY